MRVGYLALPLALALLPSSYAESSAAAAVSQLVQDANRLLAEGAFADAARTYGQAIDLDPSSYVNYYKRATAYLSLGRHSAALDDFDSILKINPAFSQAHLQKAKILAKEGDFERAQVELKAFGKGKSDDADQLASAVTAAAGARKQAEDAAKRKSWSDCVAHCSKSLETGPNSRSVRELRLVCATELGDVDAVYGDLSRLAALDPSDLELPVRAAHVAYFLLNSPAALNHVKQCLHYDPDSKPCKTLHRLFRSLDKDGTKARNFVESGDSAAARQAIKILDGDEGLIARFESAMDKAEEDGKIPKQLLEGDRKRKAAARLAVYDLACRASVTAGDFGRKGGKWCDEVLVMDEGNVEGLVSKGERLMKEENWEEAVRVLERAFENGGRSSQDVLNRVQKAQRLLKQSKQKDYYKVLGVSRDADERTIKKAFRKQAKINHPDVGGSEEKMAALNEAYEVLSDPELKQRYDNGDDPNDPTGGRQGNPFAHHGGGGMPFFFQQGGGAGGGPQFFQQGGQQFFHQGHAGGQKMHFQWG